MPTAEERKAARAAKKAELKRLAELKKRKQQHDALEREIGFGKLTAQLLEKDWRKTLMQISLPRMREELYFAWHNAERLIDVKDFTISILMDDLQCAEEQYQINLRCHAENMDRLIYLFRDQLNDMREDNEMQLARMQANAEDEANELKQGAADSQEYLKTMIFGLEMAAKEQELLVRGNYLSKIDEESSKYGNILQNLRANLEKKYNDVWEKTKDFIRHFTQHREDKNKTCNILAAQDGALQNICTQQRVKLNVMQKCYKKLKLQFVKFQESQTLKISDMKDELQYFDDAFNTLKGRCDRDRELDKNNLTLLTLASNDTKEYLNNVAEKGERILKLAAVCRKLETQEEKILPFPKSLELPPEEAAQSSVIKLGEFSKAAPLQLFWQRLAQADAIRHSINEEREALKRENDILKIKIHEYCQCVECPVLDLNPAITIKPKSSVNVVDAYMVRKTYNKMNKLN